ncbi:MAG: hypothetical protein A2W19_11450 [Spirochaetes bacterium RBG_16_49_21]|nr:MAG: hypothetical protein A2W19_11450 [Spirochaetes bacterium RBG_16_49_21]
MDIYLFSDTKNIDAGFRSIKKLKNTTVRILPASELIKTSKSAPPGSLIYADISSYNKKEIPRILKFLSKLEQCRHGILDPKGNVREIAGLFHNGACDYIGKELIKTGITPKRLEMIIKFKRLKSDTAPGARNNIEYILAVRNWEEIKPGCEYTFAFMLVELDNYNELRALGVDQFSRIINSYRRYLEELIEPFNGKIWIWMDSSCLILFPYCGGKCDEIEAPFRLMINRKLLCAEIRYCNINVSYKITMHIGNTVYRDSGETGTIVSDSLNSVFHLGQKFAEPGNFYLTEEIFSFAPARLADFFIPAGKYEGRNILRMRRIL